MLAVRLRASTVEKTADLPSGCASPSRSCELPHPSICAPRCGAVASAVWTTCRARWTMGSHARRKS
eukprot:scaffold158601_cov30-Tisochrysis_lutea.AAC.1